MAATPPQLTTDLRQAAGSEQQTRALGPVLHELERRRRPQVLDLGPAIGANVEFLSRYGVQLFIADLYRSLEAPSSQLPPDAARLRRALEDQLPAPAEAPFDLVLAWDLLNYFDAAQLAALGSHLGRLCRPGGQLFALVATRGPMCDRPLVFQIIERDLLLYETPVVAERPCPSYRETWLERQLEDFAVQTSFLLRNGMQEYVFTRRVGHAAMPPATLRRF